MSRNNNFIGKDIKNRFNFDNPIVSMILFCVAAIFFFDQTKLNDCMLMLQIWLFFIVIGFIYIVREKWDKCSDDQLMYIIIMVGFIIRFVYVLRTGIGERQNDIGSFVKGSAGHLGYIRYFYDNWKLPDFDPRNMWQFYHPPLHHIISAIWVKINVILGFSVGRAAENIQILTLFYSGLTMVFTDKIMKKLEIKRNSRAFVLCILAIFPYFVMSAGAVNNDCLATLLMLCAVYYTLVWYKNSSMKNIIILAFLVGGAMMTKMSGAMLAPPIAFVFLVKLIKERKVWEDYIFRFIAFALISIPIGLWNSVRNMINYKMPLNFVMNLGEENSQYIGDKTLFNRLFDFSFSQFDKYYMTWDAKEYGVTYNIFYALMKYASFNEFDAGLGYSDFSLFLAYLMLICMSIFTITVIVFKYYGLKKYNKVDIITKIFLFLVSGVTSIAYIIFCMDYPHLCTMNVRYLLIPIIVNLISFAAGLDVFEQSDFKMKKYVKKYIYALIVIFSVLSFIVVNSTIRFGF